MKFIIIPIMLLLSSCNTLPQLYDAAEKIADDDAIHVTVSREAIQKKTDVNIVVDVKNNQISSSNAQK